MGLTDAQRAVLAHVVVDPDAWWSHAVATLGAGAAAEALNAKVARWRPAYEAAAAQPGYQTRAVRDEQARLLRARE